MKILSKLFSCRSPQGIRIYSADRILIERIRVELWSKLVDRILEQGIKK